MKKRLSAALFFSTLPIAVSAQMYETKGEAVIFKNSTFTIGIERRNIPVPTLIDVRANPEFTSLTSDSRSGWTKCRVPLKGELGITGVTERSLVFDCRRVR